MITFFSTVPAGAQQVAAPEGRVSITQAEVDEAERRLSKIQSEVSQSYAEYEDALGKLEALNADISSTSDELVAAEGELVEAQNDLDGLAERVYRSGNVGFVDILVGAENFSDFVARLQLSVKVLTQQQAEVKRVEEVRSTLATEQDNLKTQRDQRAAAVEAAAGKRAEASGLEADAINYLSGLNGELRAAVEAQAFAEEADREKQRQILQARENALAASIQAQADAAARKAERQQAAAEAAAQAQAAADREAARQARLAQQRANAESELAAQQAAAKAERQAEITAQREAERQAAQEAAAAQQAAEAEAARQAELAAQQQAAAQAAQEQAAAEQAAAEQAAAEQASADQAAQEAAAAQQAAGEQAAAEQAAAQQQYEEEQAAAAPATDPAAGAPATDLAAGAPATDPAAGAPVEDTATDTGGGTLTGTGASANGNWQPHVATVANEVSAMFGIPATTYSGHSPSGDLAIDFMTYENTALGQQVADYLAANADAYGISYIMWNNQFYSTFPNYNGPAYTWVPWGDGEHGDHVHVSFCSSGQSGSYC